MKKLKIFILALVMSLTCFGVAAPVQAYADSEVSPASTYVTTNGLGYTINVATATNPLNINLGAPVLDETYLSTMTYTRLTRNQTTSQTYQSHKYSNISSAINDSYQISVGGNVEYDIFKASIAQNYQNTLTINYSEFESQYYAMYYYERLLFEEAIPSYTAFALTYADYYSDAFLYNLSSLVGEDVTAQDYYDFFDIFGTHLVASVKIGGLLEAYYSSVGSSITYTTADHSQIATQVQASINNLITANTSTEFVFTDSQSYISTKSIYNNTMKVIGGTQQYISTLENDIGTDFNNWNSTLAEDNAVLIGYSQGGLLPLWKILPTEYASLESTMESHFNDYITTKNNQYNTSFDYANVTVEYKKNVSTSTYDVSKGVTETVTHAGIFASSQPYHEVNLKNFFGIYPSTMKVDGVKNIEITLTLTIREIHDGYQHIYIYTDSSSSATLLWSYREEHSSGKVLKEDKTFTYVISIPVDSFTGSGYTIRYNASGNYDDSWYCKNVKVVYKLIT